MPLDMQGLRTVLGAKFDEEVARNGQYRLARHKDVADMLNRGYAEVGRIKDSTSDQNGTMIVFAPAPKPLSKSQKAEASRVTG